MGPNHIIHGKSSIWHHVRFCYGGVMFFLLRNEAHHTITLYNDDDDEISHRTRLVRAPTVVEDLDTDAGVLTMSCINRMLKKYMIEKL